MLEIRFALDYNKDDKHQSSSAFFSAIDLILAACSPTRDADKHMEFVLAWGSKGTDAGQFLYIEDFAIDANGNLLVTDALREDVQVFDPQGKFLSSFGGRPALLWINLIIYTLLTWAMIAYRSLITVESFCTNGKRKMVGSIALRTFTD